MNYYQQFYCLSIENKGYISSSCSTPSHKVKVSLSVKRYTLTFQAKWKSINSKALLMRNLQSLVSKQKNCCK